MKKLLSILGVIGLTISGASNVIACKQGKKEEKDLNEENNNDIKTWNKIMQETKNNFLNQMKKEDMVFEINQSKLYDEVSETEQNKTKDLQGTERNIIEQIIQNNFKNINDKIKEEYSNFYYDHDPIKIVENTDTFTINNIDPKAYSIIKKIPVDDTNKIKAINITYEFQIEITYKKIVQNFNNKFEFIFTTNKNFILNKISELVDYITQKINQFCNDKNNSKFIYSEKIENEGLDIFNDNINSTIVNNSIKTKFINFLQEKQNEENKNFIFKVNNNFLINKTDDESDIYKIWDDFTIKNEKLRSDEDNLEKNLVSNWLFKENNLIKDSGEDFSNFYYDENLIENEIKINSFIVNLNSISIYGLPLINKTFDNKINFYIPKQWIKERIKEFGNLIYEFFKFFNIKLNNDKTITLKVNSNLFESIKNNNNTQYSVFNILMKEFKNNKRKLKGINIFNSYSSNQFNSNLISVDNNKIFFNNSKPSKKIWSIGFSYGIFLNKFYYIPFGSENNKANFDIEKK
ncbi:lipoprotein [Spiroplasma endosymbiont of Megaselia nigra]|uniref:lipoprotein n=1 Tax=Spiroplasma endosymbiont of Megaselia nigra TaxID=2478537 RepID=UPI000F88F002|nr:lipoprotein [Spiroplasma endosymbiont of Megaselia nigra]RUO85971.1 hypothetical protein D9R21_05770 [Spiroplasma endosymbiont of Megaselia nigra]